MRLGQVKGSLLTQLQRSHSCIVVNDLVYENSGPGIGVGEWGLYNMDHRPKLRENQILYLNQLDYFSEGSPCRICLLEYALA